jgi:hypothetical protein
MVLHEHLNKCQTEFIEVNSELELSVFDKLKPTILFALRKVSYQFCLPLKASSSSSGFSSSSLGIVNMLLSKSLN